MRRVALAITAIMGLCPKANALDFRCRFVERVLFSDVILASNSIEVSNGLPRRIRVQFGIFEDATGPAPEGGFIGWNTGSIVVSGSTSNSNERRTPGRLGSFAFPSEPNANGNPPLPEGDPFEMLTEIDATLGPQARLWVCNPDGSVPPQPTPLILGLNSFVSVFEFTIDPADDTATDYTVTVSGNLFAATEWRTVGTPVPPDCGDPLDPSDDVPGSVVYEAVPTAGQPITCVLNCRVPAPGTACILGLLGVAATSRRRRALC